MKLLAITLTILAAAATRLLPHPLNFTALGAMSLFGAAYFSGKNRAWLGLFAPLVAMFLTDLFVNNVWYSHFFNGQWAWFSPYAWANYAGIAAYFFIGKLFLSRVSVGNVAFSALLGSMAFFVLSNFGSWQYDPIYPKTGAGLAAALTAGIPYYLNTLGGDIFFSTVLFGSWEMLKKAVPQLARA